MKKMAIIVTVILFAFASLSAQEVSSKSELDSLKRDVDSLKNELEILKLRKDMEKLQGELDGLKSNTPKSDSAPSSSPTISNISAPTPLYPFKKRILTLNSHGLFASALASLADNQYYIMKDNVDNLNQYIIPGTVSLDFYGVNLTSEYFVKSNISLTFDYGWNGGSVYFADSSKSELKADFNIIPLAVGFKIYPKRFSPYGFFMNPKIGATIIQAEGSIISRDQYDPNASYSEHGGRHGGYGNNFYYDASLSSETNSIKIDFDYGIYAGVEFGFRIPLFRKALSKKKVELGIDVSLLDIGYYIKPYHENTVDQLSKMYLFQGITDEKYSKYYRWRILPLSKIGFTFRF